MNDVLKEGKNFGGEFKVETSSNSIKANEPTLLTGQSIYDNPNYPAAGTYAWNGKQYWDNYYDPSLSKRTSTNKEDNIYSGDDVATRIALAGRTDQFEVLAAYAYRNKGNHYAGKNGSEFYNQEPLSDDDYVPYLSKIYPTGTEVTNTSLRTETYLFKAAWTPTDEHRLEFGFRDTDILHGEIFPSRIQWTTLLENDASAPQWPLSHVKAKAYNLEYKYKPKDNQWLDFYSNIWRTDTESNIYSSGGFPNYVNQDLGIFTNTALANSDNKREGITLSNKFNLLSNFNLTVGGSFQKEKLTSPDDYSDQTLYANGTGFRMYPRAGRREEKEFNFNFEFKPVSWLILNAGARYQNYWAFDDFLNERVMTGDTRFIEFKKATQLDMTYYTKSSSMTAEREQQIRDIINAISGYTEAQKQSEILRNIYSQRNAIVYPLDSQGKLTVANNPFLNGSLDGLDYGYFTSSGLGGYETIDLTQTGVQKNKDHGWTPTVSATINFSPASRMYFRYSEAYRMPALFETTIGFSSSQSGYGLKPEHAHNYEAAYIHDLSSLFKSSYADIKLAYYYNKTKDVIERNASLLFSNMDSQTKEGIELQGRFDNGRFFTDLSANYNFKNKVCDEHSAMIFGAAYNFKLKPCVDDGWIGGYLVSMAVPKYSINWTVGGRFLDQKLEVGTRAVYFYKYENPYAENYDGRTMTAYANTPLSWDSTTTFDAYINYRLKQDTLFELVGTNLTDEYYIDPLTRSALAAPGRTFKLSVTHKF